MGRERGRGLLASKHEIRISPRFACGAKSEENLNIPMTKMGTLSDDTDCFASLPGAAARDSDGSRPLVTLDACFRGMTTRQRAGSQLSAAAPFMVDIIAELAAPALPWSEAAMRPSQICRMLY